MSSKRLETCELDVDAWIRTTKDGYWPLPIMTARLSSEVGELAKEVLYKLGILPRKPGEKESSLEEEAGDILFTLICIMNQTGGSLDRAFGIALDKCYGRDKDRFEMKG